MRAWSLGNCSVRGFARSWACGARWSWRWTGPTLTPTITPRSRCTSSPATEGPRLLLTILGAAGESLGMDRQLRTSTAKRRVHSLFRQGCLLYDLIPNMPEERLRPLVERYEELLRQNRSFSQAFGIA